MTVYGDPGVGKSRLVAEVTAGAGARVVRGRCLPYGDGITFWPLAEIVKAEAGVHDTDPPEVALRRIRGLGEAEPVGRAGDAAVELTAARSPIERARALAELAQLADLAARAGSRPDDGESRGGDEHAGEAAVDEAGASGVAE
ncbi:MAG TPA: AAA family ATPase [Gaiellales bacterium]|nr:AAA family ATPase [Gaiellales bacterium]